MRLNLKKWAAAIVAAATCCTGSVALAQQVNPPVVISQVWGGGGNGATLPNADYVELFNRSNTPQSLSGWSLQVASGTGSAWAKLDLPATATIPVGGYYLVRVTTPSATGTAIVADAAFTTASTVLVSTTGKAALRSSTVLFTGACPVTDPDQNASIIDF
ncbi:MAG: lamin tail domain-containing protein, partial [Phycisphaerales bacterium]|nr:lamin tail domain-containing protein [Phycisphaerales bacterium]